MAVKKLPSGRRVIEFESRGRRIFRRLPSGATKAQAEEFELQLRRELIDQAVLGKTPIVPLSTAIQDWFDEVVEKPGRKDEDETRSKVKLVRAAIGEDLMLTKAGVVEATKRIGAMKRVKGKDPGTNPFTPATINRRLSIVKATATWAWKSKHWTTENLSPYVILLDKKRERVRTRIITQAQVERMIRKAKNFEARAFIALGFYGLMRRGEIVGAQPEHVARGITLGETKNGVPRVIPVVAQLKPFTKAIPFKSHPRTLYAWVEEARDAAKLPADLVHHDLRRSGATWLLNSGHVSLDVVAHILGDSLEVARKVYARVLNRTAEKAMRKGFGPIKNPSARSRIGVNR